MTSGLPLPSQTEWNFEFSPVLVRPPSRGGAPFSADWKQCRVLFEVGRVDHELLWCTALFGHLGEDFVENDRAAPAEELVLYRLGWAIHSRSIRPPQAVADHGGNEIGGPMTIIAQFSVRKWGKLLNPTHPRIRKSDQFAHDDVFLHRL
jgi:hypothetical protein